MYTVDLYDRTIQRDDAFSKRVQSADDRAHKIEFLISNAS